MVNGKAGKWEKLGMEKAGNGKSWEWKKLGMEKDGNGKRWEWKKMGMVENVKIKVLTMCRDSDRILTTGKTRPAMIAEKKNGG